MLQVFSFLALIAPTLASASADLVVYSSRSEPLIRPVLEAYQKVSGNTLRLVTDSAEGLIERIAAEGEKTSADVLMTVDVGNLSEARARGILSPMRSQAIEKNVPISLRDESGHWVAVSRRMRTIFYNPSKVNPQDLSTYESLAGARWKKRLCLRSSKKVYNQSLVALMIADLGEQKTEEVVRGWISNLATDVFPDDTKLLEAIASGRCDVGIANSYYFGRLEKKNPAISVRPFWPNQSGRGVHVNISGAAIVKNSSNKIEAQKFIEWLLTPEAQKIFAETGMEYPVVSSVSLDPVLRSWGQFKSDPTPLTRVRELQPVAVRLMDRVGYH
jgi:iron(III) transport system substrate-binding protein